MGNTEEIRELGCSYCEQSSIVQDSAQGEGPNPQNNQYKTLMEKVLKGEIVASNFTEEEGARMVATVQQESASKKEKAKKYYGSENLDLLFAHRKSNKYGMPISNNSSAVRHRGREDSQDSLPELFKQQSLETIAQDLQQEEKAEVLQLKQASSNLQL